MRGLKLAIVEWVDTYTYVAPSAGAWIETRLTRLLLTLSLVAPSVGAWIETFRKSRFLKKLTVAPSAGVWVETSMTAAR